jgi:hypothetical protein
LPEDNGGFEYTYYDKSYAFYQNYYPSFTLDGRNFVLTNAIYKGPVVSGTIYGTLDDELTTGLPYLFTVNSYSYSTGYGAVLISYDGLGDDFMTYATEDDYEVYDLVEPSEPLDGFEFVYTEPGPFNKITPVPDDDYPLDYTLSWSDSDSPNYEYCFDMVDDDECNSQWVSTGHETTAEISGLLYETTYYWQVRAVNSTGTTDAVDGWDSFTTGELDAPGEFDRLSPDEGAENQPTRLTLEWDDSSYGAYVYEYCYYPDDGDSETEDDICTGEDFQGNWVSTGSATSANINVEFGTTYWWQVRAKNWAGDKTEYTYAKDGVQDFWAFTTTDTFGKVSPIDGATNQNTNVSLRWDAIGVDKFEYCYDTDLNGCSRTSGVWVDVGKASSVDLKNLDYKTTYYWQVRATNSLDMVIYANDDTGVWSFTIRARNNPTPFGKRTPIDGAEGQPTSLTLDWDDYHKSATYEYCYYAEDDDTCNGEANQVNWKSSKRVSSATINGLDNGTTYFWQVRAVMGKSLIYADDGETDFWEFTTAE